MSVSTNSEASIFRAGYEMDATHEPSGETGAERDTFDELLSALSERARGLTYERQLEVEGELICFFETLES